MFPTPLLKSNLNSETSRWAVEWGLHWTSSIFCLVGGLALTLFEVCLYRQDFIAEGPWLTLISSPLEWLAPELWALVSFTRKMQHAHNDKCFDTINNPLLLLFFLKALAEHSSIEAEMPICVQLCDKDRKHKGKVTPEITFPLTKRSNWWHIRKNERNTWKKNTCSNKNLSQL